MHALGLGVDPCSLVGLERRETGLDGLEDLFLGVELGERLLVCATTQIRDQTAIDRRQSKGVLPSKPSK